MRFFRSALAPAIFTAEPLVYEIKDSVIRKIWMARDLSLLQVHCHPSKAGIKKVRSALKAAVDDIPYAQSLTAEAGVFYVSPFYDARLELSRIMNEIKATDPSYFTRSDDDMESLGFDEKDSAASAPDYFMSSPLHAKYFCMQGLRGSGMQHTIEVPLKSLREHQFLSQQDLNRIALQVWSRVADLCRAEEKSSVKLPETTEVPYLFSSRK